MGSPTCEAVTPERLLVEGERERTRSGQHPITHKLQQLVHTTDRNCHISFIGSISRAQTHPCSSNFTRTGRRFYAAHHRRGFPGRFPGCRQLSPKNAARQQPPPPRFQRHEGVGINLRGRGENVVYWCRMGSGGGTLSCFSRCSCCWSIGHVLGRTEHCF